MSTVIIGGGSRARQAVTDLESASLAMDQARRDAAEAFLGEFASCIKAFCDADVAFPSFPSP